MRSALEISEARKTLSWLISKAAPSPDRSALELVLEWLRWVEGERSSVEDSLRSMRHLRAVCR